MPRRLPPEGRWVHVPVYLRAADVERLDVAALAAGFVHQSGEKAGEANRSVWMRALALAALDAGLVIPQPGARWEWPAEVPVTSQEAAPERPARKKRAPKRGADPEAAAPPEVTATDGALALKAVNDPAEVPAVVRALQEGATIGPSGDEGCGHVFPDVKFVAGKRVCKRCDK